MLLTAPLSPTYPSANAWAIVHTSLIADVTLSTSHEREINVTLSSRSSVQLLQMLASVREKLSSAFEPCVQTKQILMRIAYFF